VAEILRPLGLHWRTALLRELALTIVASGVPKTHDELRRLPGVGQYAASAYLSLHRETRAVLIDANIVRWLCRMTGKPMNGETRRQRWIHELGESLTPKRAFRAYNYAALDFTMNICGKKPRCGECPIRRHCAYGCASAPPEGILNGHHAQ
jgi:A/G-specific adenine glycosylase